MALEQHAVPTEVTTYEFRLVGDMTLKQFGWLAGGIILAIFWYSMPIPSYFRWPLVLIFGCGGAAIAFVPYEGRTLDRWIISFIKAIYSPTEFVWHKEKRIPPYLESRGRARFNLGGESSKMTTQEQAKLREYIQSLPLNSNINEFDIEEASKLTNIANMFQSSPTSLPSQTLPQPISYAPTPVASPQPSGLDTIDFNSVTEVSTPAPSYQSVSTNELEAISQQVAQQIGDPTPGTLSTRSEISSHGGDEYSDLAQILASGTDQNLPSASVATTDQSSIPQTPALPTGVNPQMNPALQQVMSQNTSEFSQYHSQISPPPSSHLVNAEPVTQITDSETSSNPQIAQFLPPAPTQPNIIVGAALSNQQQSIENAIIEIIDAQGQPVRALKTNKLGQFAIATPLANGTYQIHVEKAPFEFTAYSVTLEGQIVPPLAIQAH